VLSEPAGGQGDGVAVFSVSVRLAEPWDGRVTLGIFIGIWATPLIAFLGLLAHYTVESRRDSEDAEVERLESIPVLGRERSS
jgi:hypothetical protein